MKTKYFFYLCVLFAGLVFFACAGDNVTIKQKVEATLAAEGYTGISVSVLNGVVTLTGTVDSEDSKNEVEGIVRNVKFVKSITNNIFVGSGSTLFSAENDEKMKDTISKALTDAGYNNITVSVQDGEARITGEATEEDLEKIMQIVNEAGPEKVINEVVKK